MQDGGVSVLLPGGVMREGRRQRGAVFRPLDGWLEERISGFIAEADPVPAMVSRILDAALLSLGGMPVEAGMAASLVIADRQWLMLNLAHQLRAEGDYWLQGCCQNCDSPFDLHVHPLQLPVVPAGEGYPHASVMLDGDRLCLRLPTGADQEKIVLADADTALSMLLSACLLSVNDAPVPPAYLDGLDEAQRTRLEEALDAVSPHVGVNLTTACPECGRHLVMEINPYGFLAAFSEEILREVHILAACYHWSERDILSLPRDRRKRYLRMIERDGSAGNGY